MQRATSEIVRSRGAAMHACAVRAQRARAPTSATSEWPTAHQGLRSRRPRPPASRGPSLNACSGARRRRPTCPPERSPTRPLFAPAIDHVPALARVGDWVELQHPQRTRILAASGREVPLALRRAAAQPFRGPPEGLGELGQVVARRPGMVANVVELSLEPLCALVSLELVCALV